MAEAGPLDTQRESRWPNHTPPSGTGAGVKVKFHKYEEDPYASDSEDEVQEDPWSDEEEEVEEVKMTE